MPNYIEMITKEKCEHKLLPNANPAMALPFLATLLVPQFGEKKMTQRTLSGKVVPPSTHENVPPVKIKSNGNKKSPRPSTPRRRQEQQNMKPFPKCKMIARRVSVGTLFAHPGVEGSCQR
jgi:hypothetical protein